MYIAIVSYALACLFILLSITEGKPLTIEPANDTCAPKSCQERHGPVVQFPFWLEKRQPDHCGFAGFNLSCSEDNHTLISLPNSTMLYVTTIDYKNQVIRVQDPNHCLPLYLRNLNMSSFSFKDYYYFDYYTSYNYTLFNCSSPKRDEQNDAVPGAKFPCLSVPGHDVYAVESSADLSYTPLIGCESTGRTIDFLPSYLEDIMDEISLVWDQPKCFYCAEAGKRCRLKNGTISETECFVVHKSHGHDKLLKLEISFGVVACFLLFMVLGGLCSIYHKNRKDKENQMKIEKFLEDYKAFKPTRFTYADIKRITNQFKERLGEGAYGTVYKGKLSNEIFVAVKILNNSVGKGEEFINEVGTMGRIHHVNVVRLVGFCADGFRRALVYEFLPNESLEKYIFPNNDTLNPSLSWEKLEDIALGAAKGIEYLHQGCDQRILHFDIKPHNILLDDNLNPKISDFGLAKLCSKEQSAVSMTAARGTMGYIAPEVFSRNFGNVSYKSDVYSFGMLLLEMVGGRKNKDVTYQDTSRMDFPEWVYKHLDRGEELNIRIEVEGDSKIARKMAIVGLWCIQWYPADRPSMKTVVQMLEGEECPVMPRNPFTSGNAADGGNARPRIWNLELEVIAE